MSANDMDRPFREFGARVDPGEFDVQHPTLCGGLDVFATVITADGFELPSVIFCFARADGSGFTEPLMLVSTHDQLAKLPQLIGETVAAAIAAAKGPVSGG